MVKTIITSNRRLSYKCEDAWSYGRNQIIAQDLLDTAKFHQDKSNCVGLAANQIGELARIIVVKTMIDPNEPFTVMVNPEYKLRFGGFKSAIETCLSHPDKRQKVRRYKKLKLSFYDIINDQVHENMLFKNLEARIIQHEIDHLNGILI